MDAEIFFEDAKTFNNWLEINHQDEKVLWLCYYKKHTKKQSITWPESVEEALCYGWIDGLRKSLNNESYKIRFTPRKKESIWSKKNIETVAILIKEKLIKPTGLVAFNHRKEHKSAIYSYEQPAVELSDKYHDILKNEMAVWNYFNSLIPSVKKPSIQWVMSAKKQETRDRRLAILLESCRTGEVVPPLRWTRKKT